MVDETKAAEKGVAPDTGLPYSTASQPNLPPKPVGKEGQKSEATGLPLKQPDSLSAKLLQSLMHVSEGVTGTLNYGGYFAEEYLATLKGRGGVLIYDEMRRGDYQVAAVLRNIKSRLKGARYNWESCEVGDAEGQQHAELLNYAFFQAMNKTWKENLQDVLGLLDFGFSVFEPSCKSEIHPEFGNIWVLKSLGWRSQKTIWRWIIRDDKIVSVEQISWGDDSAMTMIDGENLLVFSNDREGNNFEGISILRSAYGPWFRKQLYHTINGIGIERSSIGVVDVEVPPEKMGSKEETRLDTAMTNFLLGQTPYLKRPEGWKLTITKNEYDSEAVQKAIRMEDANIAKSVMTEFIELGLTDTGTQALSESKVDNFVKSLVYIADVICEGFRPLAEKIIKYNYGVNAKLKAKLRVTGLDETAGLEMAQAFKALADAGLMDIDETNKEHVRKLYRLPERAKEAAVDAAGDQATADADKGDGAAQASAQTQEGKATGQDQGPSAEQIQAGMKQEAAEHGHTISELLKNIPAEKRPPFEKIVREIVDANLKTNPNEYKGSMQAHEHGAACGCAEPGDKPAQRRAPRPYERKVKFAEIEKRFADNNAAVTATIKAGLQHIFKKYRHDLANVLSHAGNAKEKYQGVANLRLGYGGKFASNIEETIGKAVAGAYAGAKTELANAKKVALGEPELPYIYQMSSTSALPPGIRGWIKANAKVIADAQMGAFKNKVTLAAVKALDNDRSDDQVLSDTSDAAGAYLADAAVMGSGIIAQKAENEGRWAMFQENKGDIAGFEFSAMLENSCELCAELDGATFKIEDPDSTEYTPPLHPQCECIIVPIMNDEEQPEQWDGLDTVAEQFSPSELEKLKKLTEAK